jgi:multidrug efflux system membrane fusion protein
VRLAGGERARAVLVRDAAVGTDQDRKFVLVMKPDSTLEYRRVTLGRLTDGLRVVATGLASGERVVVNGLQRVRPGAKVAATQTAMVRDAAPAVVAAAR